MLSDDLQAVIGQAIVDAAFRDQLLTNPRAALVGLKLSATDRRSAGAISGASSLAEYVVLLEQMLSSGSRGRVAVRPSRRRKDMRAAS